jgi:hypothetical protein
MNRCKIIVGSTGKELQDRMNYFFKTNPNIFVVSTNITAGSENGIVILISQIIYKTK